MEQAMGTWCKVVETSPGLLMEKEPERHFPDTCPLSPTSTQFTDLELNQYCRGFCGYTHFLLKVAL